MPRSRLPAALAATLLLSAVAAPRPGAAAPSARHAETAGAPAPDPVATE